MTAYHRHRRAGASYFFTVNLATRTQSLLTEQIDVLRQAIRTVKNRHPFVIDALVVLPDHLHAIWTLPSADDNYALRWRLIKTEFSSQPLIIPHAQAAAALLPHAIVSPTPCSNVRNIICCLLMICMKPILDSLGDKQ